jgi:hypothetical protein
MSAETVAELDKEIAELNKKKAALLTSELQKAIDGLGNSYKDGISRLADDKSKGLKTLLKDVVKVAFGEEYQIKKQTKQNNKKKPSISIDEKNEAYILDLVADGNFYTKKSLADAITEGGEFKQTDWTNFCKRYLVSNDKKGREIEFRLSPSGNQKPPVKKKAALKKK